MPNSTTLWLLSPYRRALIAGLAAVSATGCVDVPELATNRDRAESFEEFRDRTPRQPGETGAYIVEGDMPFYGDEALREYWESLDTAGELAIGYANGAYVKWNATTKRNLTYCIDNSLGANKPESCWPSTLQPASGGARSATRTCT